MGAGGAARIEDGEPGRSVRCAELVLERKVGVDEPVWPCCDCTLVEEVVLDFEASEPREL
jgi:hypothetical protein